MIGRSSWQVLWTSYRKMTIGLTILLPLLAGTLAYRHYILLPQLVRTEKDFLRQQTDMRLERAGRARIQGPAAEYRQNIADLERFDSNVPPERAFPELIGDLYRLAATADLSISAVSYQAAPLEDSRLLAYTLQFSMPGRYAEVKRFLHLIETSPRLISINGWSLSGDEKGKASLQLKLTTYFLAEETMAEES